MTNRKKTKKNDELNKKNLNSAVDEFLVSTDVHDREKTKSSMRNL